MLLLAVSACTQGQQQVAVDREVQALIEQAPSEQHAALADGKVSRAEYDEAARAYETCLHDQGWTGATVEWQEPARDGLAGSWSTRIGGLTDETTPQFETAMDECGDRYLWPLGTIHDLQHTDPRVLDEHLAELQDQSPPLTVTDDGP